MRRQEEIIWLRVQGFARVVSLLPSPHNLPAYEEKSWPVCTIPCPLRVTPGGSSASCYRDLDGWLAAGERILVHQDELGDRVMGVVAGYLVWSDRLPAGPRRSPWSST